ncbi:hypothetical protein AVEN_99172-1 [Araneus ventricosus]|uniref:RNase H type-1 domain-containing protein n=1 Tax=Araneus ventricosus TaxID=182803 RepID=A0A4Y2CJQ1_ARAVE|nr:hypothetical protein AVEN_99172-1 [Araneus ventricosus]
MLNVHHATCFIELADWTNFTLRALITCDKMEDENLYTTLSVIKHTSPGPDETFDFLSAHCQLTEEVSSIIKYFENSIQYLLGSRPFIFASCLLKYYPVYDRLWKCSIWLCSTFLKRFDYVHHQALRLCLGAYRTSPVPSLYAEAFEPSLSCRRHKLSLSYYFRILSKDNHPLRETLLNGNNNRLFNARPLCIPHFGLRMRNILPDTFHYVKVHTNDFLAHPPWMENSLSYINHFGNFNKSDFNNSVLISLFNQHRQFYQSYQPVFKDGSKSLNHIGYAFFINGHIVSYKLHSFTSVFSSEITAVYFALKYIDVHEIRKSILYTDSISLLEFLRSSSTHNPLIEEVKDFYRHLLSKGSRILFSWVPSHLGITGNELADKSAKSATEFLTRPIVYADVRSAVSQWCHYQWQEKWNMETNNKLNVIKPVL